MLVIWIVLVVYLGISKVSGFTWVGPVGCLTVWNAVLHFLCRCLEVSNFNYELGGSSGGRMLRISGTKADNLGLLRHLLGEEGFGFMLFWELE